MVSIAEQREERKESVNQNDRTTETTQTAQQRENRLKCNQQSSMNLQDYNKRSNICVTGVLEGEEKKGGAKKVLKNIMAENFPNVIKHIHQQIQEAT